MPVPSYGPRQGATVKWDKVRLRMLLDRSPGHRTSSLALLFAFGFLLCQRCIVLCTTLVRGHVSLLQQQESWVTRWQHVRQAEGSHNGLGVMTRGGRRPQKWRWEYKTITAVVESVQIQQQNVQLWTTHMRWYTAFNSSRVSRLGVSVTQLYLTLDSRTFRICH